MARRKNKPFISKRSYQSVLTLATQRTDLQLSKDTVTVLDDMMKDIFERIASQASTLRQNSNRCTLTERDVHYATIMELPGDLAVHAHRFAQMNLSRVKHGKPCTKATNNDLSERQSENSEPSTCPSYREFFSHIHDTPGSQHHQSTFISEDALSHSSIVPDNVASGRIINTSSSSSSWNPREDNGPSNNNNHRRKGCDIS